MTKDIDLCSLAIHSYVIVFGSQTSSKGVTVTRYEKSPRSVVTETASGDVKLKRRMTWNVLSRPATPHKPVSVPLIPLPRATPAVAQHIVDQPKEEPHTELEQHPANDAVAD